MIGILWHVDHRGSVSNGRHHSHLDKAACGCLGEDVCSHATAKDQSHMETLIGARKYL